MNDIEALDPRFREDDGKSFGLLEVPFNRARSARYAESAGAGSLRNTQALAGADATALQIVERA